MSFDLITFGCSWTKGCGVGYEKGMNLREYDNVVSNKEICDKHSFRGVLSKRWGCDNINYGCTGSSNMRQFRHALEHFKSKPKRKTIVLWAITSIFRHEVWCNKRMKKKIPQGKGYSNILYGHAHNLFTPISIKQDPFWKNAHVDVNEHLEYHFDVDNEIQVLCNQMDHWNLFFESIGVENYWMDTFNHHDYPRKISRMLFNDKPKRDLLSMLVKNYSDDTYHKSQYDPKDSQRIYEAKEIGLVNPFSLHPTKEAHVMIANFIDEEINLINNIR